MLKWFGTPINPLEPEQMAFIIEYYYTKELGYYMINQIEACKDELQSRGFRFVPFRQQKECNSEH